MGQINISAFGLAFGAVGQALLLGNFLDRVPDRLVFVLLLGPWLLVYAISFCKVAPCTPKRFAQLLIIAMAWYSLDTLICELVWLLVPTSRSRMYPAAIPHMLCFGAALAFIVLTRAIRYTLNYQIND